MLQGAFRLCYKNHIECTRFKNKTYFIESIKIHFSYCWDNRLFLSSVLDFYINTAREKWPLYRLYKKIRPEMHWILKCFCWKAEKKKSLMRVSVQVVRSYSRWRRQGFSEDSYNSDLSILSPAFTRADQRRNNHSVIIHSPSCHSKAVLFFFYSLKQEIRDQASEFCCM